jgi:hypothetical protein
MTNNQSGREEDDSENNNNSKSPSHTRITTSTTKKIMLSVAAAAIAATVVLGTNAFQLTEATSSMSAERHDDDNPTKGYDIHVTVGRHDSAQIDAQMDHYCKLDDRIVAVCQLYSTTNDIKGGGPQLSQIEFIITDKQYLQLPLRERPNWHNHAVELTPERGAPTCVELPKGLECSALVGILQKTYGKVITIWDPADGLPRYPPYAFLVDSPFALDQDLNDDLHEEWPVGEDETGSSDILPRCTLHQAGPCK